jgi:hypothetical protein
VETDNYNLETPFIIKAPKNIGRFFIEITNACNDGANGNKPDGDNNDLDNMGGDNNRDSRNIPDDYNTHKLDTHWLSIPWYAGNARQM